MKIEPRLEFDSTIPAEMLDAIRTALEPALCLAPRWCANLYVTYSDVPHEGARGLSAATMEVMYAYRTGRLTIYPSWFSSTSEYRNDVLRHEMLHLLTGVICNWAIDELKELTKENTELQRVLLTECSDRCESVVEDLLEVLEYPEAFRMPRDSSGAQLRALAKMMEKKK